MLQLIKGNWPKVARQSLVTGIARWLRASPQRRAVYLQMLAMFPVLDRLRTRLHNPNDLSRHDKLKPLQTTSAVALNARAQQIYRWLLPSVTVDRSLDDLGGRRRR